MRAKTTCNESFTDTEEMLTKAGIKRREGNSPPNHAPHEDGEDTDTEEMLTKAGIKREGDSPPNHAPRGWRFQFGGSIAGLSQPPTRIRFSSRRFVLQNLNILELQSMTSKHGNAA